MLGHTQFQASFASLVFATVLSWQSIVYWNLSGAELGFLLCVPVLVHLCSSDLGDLLAWRNVMTLVFRVLALYANTFSSISKGNFVKKKKI